MGRRVGKPRIVRKQVEYACPWFEVESKDVDLGGARGEERFFTVKTETYVAVLAVTTDGRIPVVQIYRPAVEEVVIELPSGRVEPGESFEDAVRRELLEETGCRATDLRRIAMLYTDTGRMQTRQWGFFAPGAELVAEPASPDEDLSLLFIHQSELRSLIAGGGLATSAHLGVICVAWAKGLLGV